MDVMGVGGFEGDIIKYSLKNRFFQVIKRFKENWSKHSKKWTLYLPLKTLVFSHCFITVIPWREIA